MSLVKVLIYPKATNPYQDLLYKNVNSREVILTYLPSFVHLKRGLGYIYFIILLVKFRFKGYKVFHLHWLYEFQIYHSSNVFIKLVFTFYVLFCFVLIRMLGYKLIWTVHDLITHDKQFVDDILVSRILALLSNYKIIHSKFSRILMAQYRVTLKNTIYIPLGGYVGYYSNKISKYSARKILGIPEDVFVYAFIGRIEKYKGILELLDAFEKSHLPNSILLIAGECTDSLVINKLNEYSEDNRIKIVLGFIENHELQIYFNASDVIVMPFRFITNTSTVLLAGSFSKAIIAPKIGSINDLPEDIGYFYDQNNERSFIDSLKFTYFNKVDVYNRGLRSMKYINTIIWKDISKRTLDIYKTLG